VVCLALCHLLTHAAVGVPQGRQQIRRYE
jgi:hypothetical protein